MTLAGVRPLCEKLRDEGDLTPACPVDDASGRQVAFIGKLFRKVLLMEAT